MYATLDHLKTLCGDEELIQLTDRSDPPSDAIDESVVALALSAAGNEIDGYVAAQYAVPLATVPALLVNLAADIARYRLYKDAPTDQARKRYEDAVKTLTNISKGIIKLPIEGSSGSSAEPAGRDGVMVIESEERIFSRSTMRGW